MTRAADWKVVCRMAALEMADPVETIFMRLRLSIHTASAGPKRNTHGGMAGKNTVLPCTNFADWGLFLLPRPPQTGRLLPWIETAAAGRRRCQESRRSSWIQACCGTLEGGRLAIKSHGPWSHGKRQTVEAIRAAGVQEGHFVTRRKGSLANLDMHAPARILVRARLTCSPYR